MNIYIRTDSSLSIGTGHVFRCLVLADELKKRGHNVTFLSACMLEQLQKTINKKGHALKLIFNKNLDKPLCLSRNYQNKDANASISFFVDSIERVDWLIVDCYHLDKLWEKQLRPFVKKIFVIDDLANRNHNCDLLLDANYYCDMNNRYVKKAINSRMLLGPKYFLVRKEFRKFYKSKYKFTNTVKRVFIFFGGVDKDNWTKIILETLVKINIKNLEVDVVVGNNNINKDQIKLLCEKFNYNFYKQPDNFSNLLSKSDISISAGGVALYERLFMEIPTFAISCADNQKSQVEDLAQEGMIYFFDIATKCNLASLKCHLQAFIENFNLRKYINKKCKNFVDGLGVDRVVSAMNDNIILFREAIAEDESCIFKWRNEEKVRNSSLNNAKIKKTDHKRWFKNILDNKNVILVIAFYDNNPIAVVRFDIDDDRCASISIYKVKQKIDVKGVDILLAAENWLLERFPQVKKFRCDILYSNQASIKMFEHAGYKMLNIEGLKII